MSTRARVGILCDDGKVMSIYQHWDGYPSCLGRTLLENYKDKEKVEKLIALGDCSSIREEVDIPEGMTHTFNNPLDNVTIAYGRDRGETGIDPKVSTEKEFWEEWIEEYGYLFKDGVWYVATSHGKSIGEPKRVDNGDGTYCFNYDECSYVKIAPCDRKIVELTEIVCDLEDKVLIV